MRPLNFLASLLLMMMLAAVAFLAMSPSITQAQQDNDVCRENVAVSPNSTSTPSLRISEAPVICMDMLGTVSITIGGDVDMRGGDAGPCGVPSSRWWRLIMRDTGLLLIQTHGSCEQGEGGPDDSYITVGRPDVATCLHNGQASDDAGIGFCSGLSVNVTADTEYLVGLYDYGANIKGPLSLTFTLIQRLPLQQGAPFSSLATQLRLYRWHDESLTSNGIQPAETVYVWAYSAVLNAFLPVCHMDGTNAGLGDGAASLACRSAGFAYGKAPTGQYLRLYTTFSSELVSNLTCPAHADRLMECHGVIVASTTCPAVAAVRCFTAGRPCDDAYIGCIVPTDWTAIQILSTMMRNANAAMCQEAGRALGLAYIALSEADSNYATCFGVNSPDNVTRPFQGPCDTVCPGDTSQFCGGSSSTGKGYSLYRVDPCVVPIPISEQPIIPTDPTHSLPSGLSPEVAHFDASHGVNTTASGDVVTWQDMDRSRTGNVFNFTAGCRHVNSTMGAIAFPGSTCYGHLLGDLPDSWSTSERSAFTVVWIGRSVKLPTNQILLTLSRPSREQGSDGLEHQLSIGSTSVYTFGSTSTGYGISSSDSNADLTMPSDEWTMEVLVRDPGSMTATYYRARQFAANIASYSLQSTPVSIERDNFVVGADWRDNNQFLQGFVGVILLYNRSLDASDITALALHYKRRFNLLMGAISNLAFRQSIYASSSVYPSPPSYAIDGTNTWGYFYTGSSNDEQPWISIDLGVNATIVSVIIINRCDCCAARLQNAELRIGSASIRYGRNNGALDDTMRIRRNALIWKQDSSLGLCEARTISFAEPLVGRWITLQNMNPGDDRALSLTELQVFGTGVQTAGCLETANEFGVYGCGGLDSYTGSAQYFTELRCPRGTYITSIAQLLGPFGVYQVTIGCSDGYTTIGPQPAALEADAPVIGTATFKSRAGFRAVSGSIIGCYASHWDWHHMTTTDSPQGPGQYVSFQCPAPTQRISHVRLGGNTMNVIVTWRFCCTESRDTAACPFSTIPAGSYQSTCNSCTLEGCVLTCACQGDGAVPLMTQLDIMNCRPGWSFNNINGQLACAPFSIGGNFGRCPGGLYRVMQGDTCASIARNLDITIHGLLATNSTIDCNSLPVGQQLCIKSPQNGVGMYGSNFTAGGGPAWFTQPELSRLIQAAPAELGTNMLAAPVTTQTESLSQMWQIRVIDTTNALHTIHPVGDTGTCWEVSGGAQENGARVLLAPCMEGGNLRNSRKWLIVQSCVDGVVHLIALHSGKCLDTESAVVQQWECNWDVNQRFVIGAGQQPGQAVDPVYILRASSSVQNYYCNGDALGPEEACKSGVGPAARPSLDVRTASFFCVGAGSQSVALNRYLYMYGGSESPCTSGGSRWYQILAIDTGRMYIFLDTPVEAPDNPLLFATMDLESCVGIQVNSTAANEAAQVAYRRGVLSFDVKAGLAYYVGIREPDNFIVESVQITFTLVPTETCLLGRGPSLAQLPAPSLSKSYPPLFCVDIGTNKAIQLEHNVSLSEGDETPCNPKTRGYSGSAWWRVYAFSSGTLGMQTCYDSDNPQNDVAIALSSDVSSCSGNREFSRIDKGTRLCDVFSLRVTAGTTSYVAITMTASSLATSALQSVNGTTVTLASSVNCDPKQVDLASPTLLSLDAPTLCMDPGMTYTVGLARNLVMAGGDSGPCYSDPSRWWRFQAINGSGRLIVKLSGLCDFSNQVQVRLHMGGGDLSECVTDITTPGRCPSVSADVIAGVTYQIGISTLNSSILQGPINMTLLFVEPVSCETGLLAATPALNMLLAPVFCIRMNSSQTVSLKRNLEMANGDPGPCSRPGSRWWRLQAMDTGLLVIRTSGSCEHAGMGPDDSWITIGNSDLSTCLDDGKLAEDAGPGYCSVNAYNVTANETYYIGIYDYSNDIEGPMNVSVSLARPDPSGMTAPPPPQGLDNNHQPSPSREGMPPWSHTCQVHIKGSDGGGHPSNATASIVCWAADESSGSDAGDAILTGPCDRPSVDPVEVQIGRALAPMLSKACGIKIMSASRDDSETQRSSSVDWGVTFMGVPHLRLLDSVVSDVLLSSAGPLLSCSGCSYLSLQNVTMQTLVGQPERSTYGPLYGDYLLGVSVINTTCTNVTASHGWACILASYRWPQPGLFFDILDSSISYNEVASDGRLGLACPGGLITDSSQQADSSGYGAIVLLLSGSNSTNGTASGALDIRIYNSKMDSNRGGCGSAFAVLVNETATGNATVNMAMLSILANSSISGNVGTGLYGGAVYVSNTAATKLSVAITDNSVLARNSAAGYGGALYAQELSGTMIVMSNSSFVMNRAQRGGAVYYSTISGSFVSDSSTMEGNSALTGGVMYTESLVGSLTFSRCHVTANNATLDGGVLYTDLLSGTLTVTNESRVEHNIAGRHGGFVYAGRVMGHMVIAKESNVLNNTALANGGAIMSLDIPGSLSVVDGSSMSANRAGGLGGAVAAAQSITGLILIAGGSMMMGNNAGDSGGAVYTERLVGNVTISGGSTLSGNRAARNGGAVCASTCPGSFRIQASSSMSSNAASRQGGAVFCDSHVGFFAVTEQSEVVLNQAKDGGGALYASGDIDYFMLDGALLQGNKAYDGGAVYAVGSLNHLRVSGSSTLSDNSALVNGGVFYVLMAVRQCVVSNMSRVAGNYAGQNGGVLFTAELTSFQCSSSHFWRNTALNGGVVYSEAIHSLQAFSSQFHNNSVVNDGGAIFAAKQSDAEWSLRGSTFIGNKAGRFGGAVYIGMEYNTKLSASNSAGQYQQQSPSVPILLNYLGEHTQHHRFQLSHGTFIENSAGQAGGALAVNQHADVSQATSPDLHGGNPVVTVCEAAFERNSAELGSGGAIHVQAGIGIIVSSSTLEGNRAAINGGALAGVGCSFLFLSNGTRVATNLAFGGGGGISSVNCSLTAVLLAELTGNVASSGAGIHITGSDAGQTPSVSMLYQVKIQGNAAVIFVEGQQSAAGYGGAIFTGSNAGHVAVIESSIVGNSAWLGAGIASFQRCLVASPQRWTVLLEDIQGVLASSSGVPGNNCSLLVLQEQDQNDGDWAVWSSQHEELLQHASLPTANFPQLAPHKASFAWFADPALSSLLLACNSADNDGGTAQSLGTASLPSATVVLSMMKSCMKSSTEILADYQWIETPVANMELSGLTNVCTQSMVSNEETSVAEEHRKQQCAAYTVRPGQPTNLGIRLLDHGGRSVSSVPHAGANKVLLAFLDGPGQLAQFAGYNSQRLVDTARESLMFCLPAVAGFSKTASCNASSAVVYIQPVSPADTTVQFMQGSIATSILPNGTAQWNLDIHAWPGTYVVKLWMEGVPPIAFTMEVAGCTIGEALNTDDGEMSLQKYVLGSCSQCPRREVGLLPDPRSQVGTSQDVAKLVNAGLVASVTCKDCPGNAACPGGSVIVPLPGYWHAAPNSMSIHRCPNMDACSYDADTVASIHNCSDGQFFQSINASLQVLGVSDYRTLHLCSCQAVWQGRADTNNTGPSFHVRLKDSACNITCYPSGLPSDDPASYMQQLCADGYTGNLCAACKPGHYVDMDFNCNTCSSVAQTVGIGLLCFTGSVAVVSWALLTSFGSGGEGEWKASLPGDILKIAIVHVQWLNIITRLSIAQPDVLVSFSGLVTALTGAENLFTYSHACLQPDQDSAGQARLQLLGALLTPCAVTAAVLVIWTIRYICLNNAVLQRGRTIRRSSNRIVSISQAAVKEAEVQSTPGSSRDMVAGSNYDSLSRSNVSARTSVLRDYFRNMTKSVLVGSVRSMIQKKGASPVSGLAYADQALRLHQQLGIAIMMSAFVLYPSWAQAAFSIFSCYIIDRGDGQLGHEYKANHPYGYWLRNMNQECYTGVHAAVYVPIGIVALIIFCLMPPMVSAIMMFRARARLQDYRTEQVLGFMYSRYRLRYFWWDSALQLQTLLLVAVDVFGRSMDLQYQALMLSAVLTATASINVLVAPLRSKLLRRLEYASYAVLILTITLNMYFVVGDDALINGAEGVAISVIILMLNSGLIAFFCGLVVHRSWSSIKSWFHTPPSSASTADTPSPQPESMAVPATVEIALEDDDVSSLPREGPQQ